MKGYLARRLLLAIPVLIAISLVIFVILRLAPGGPMAVYAMGQHVDPAELAAIEARLGLNKPIHLQYINWLSGMVTGNWGRSYKDTRKVTEVVWERLPATLQLMVASIIIALILGVAFGVLSAISRRPFLQYLSSVFSMLGVSIPTFWLGLIIILVFSVKLGLLPTGGISTVGEPFSVVDRLWHIIAPATVLATLNIAGWSRYVRSSLLEVLSQEYIRTAYAKGLPQTSIIFKHALRNALLPLITLLGLESSRLVGGAMVTEVVFAWPGVGRLLLESLVFRDYPVLMGTFMLMSLLVVVGNIVADICYSLADPRIRFA